MAYKYDKNKDYSKLMQDAANAGNWEQAAIYEQQRNAKIQGEGLSQYATSQNYARYLPTNYGYNANTDYQKLMDQAVAGGDMARAAIYEQQRNQKIREGNGGSYTMSYKYTDYLPGMSQQVGMQAYKNPYQQQLDDAIAKLGDESELKKQYLAQADRQTQDTLGAYAANTGGIASTGAVAAAQQAGANVRSQLGTAIMNQRGQYTNALMNASGLAQSEHQMQISEAMNRWQQLGYADDFVSSILGVAPGTGTSSQNYQLWQQKYQQEQADRNWQNTLWQQQYQQQQADRNWQNTQWQQGYQQEQADRNWQNTQWQQGYQQEQADRNWQNTQWQQGYQQQQADRGQANTEKNQTYAYAMNMLQTGAMPSAELLAAAGITQAEAEQLANYYTQQGQKSDRSQAYTMAMNVIQTGGMPSQELLTAAGIDKTTAEQLAAYYKRQQAYQTAMNMLSVGIMPGNDLLAAAGITPAQAQQIQQAATAKGGNSSGGGGGGGGSSGGSSGGTSGTGTPLKQSQLESLMKAYEKGDGSWVTKAKSFLATGYDLSTFCQLAGLDPADPFGEQKPANAPSWNTQHAPSGNAQSILRELQAIAQRGDAQMVVEMITGYVKNGKMTAQEAAWVADQLGVRIN